MKDLILFTALACLCISLVLGGLFILLHLPTHNYKVCSLEDGTLTPSTDCTTGAIQWGGQCVTVWPENTNAEIFYCKDIWLQEVTSTNQ